MTVEQLLDGTLDIIAPIDRAKKEEELARLKATLEELKSEGYALNII